ncbi:MAG: class I SAM-dependent methyltransferase [Thermoplasmata archaeon]|nr:class I SAM-dependent methyltransferase [Thermoplasmata archaeon]
MSFEETYQTRTPPWDIGRPQDEVVRLLDEGSVVAPVLDIGCGTGEHALACAARGLEALGVDGAPTAIAKARAKAAERGLRAQFEVGDALDLTSLRRTFRTVLDSGLFHVFDDEERPRYAASLRAVLTPGGSAFLLCFSDAEPNWGGPRRVTAAEIHATFDALFTVGEIVRARFLTTDPNQRVEAWRVRLDRSAA